MEKELPCFALLTMHSGVTFGELASSVQPVTRPNPLSDVLTVPIGRMSEPQADDLTRLNGLSTLTDDASRRIDVPIAIGMTIFVVLLKTRVFPEFFVEKTFELRSEVCDKNE